MSASSFRLDNLVALIDCNGIQADGKVVLDMEPVAEKWRAFGFHVEMIDGHDHGALLDVLGADPDGRDKPLCVIANTIKGKGVSFMEDNVSWHHGVPNDEQFAQAMRELV